MSIFPLELGTVSSWTTAAGVFTLIGLFLKFIPSYIRSKADERVSDSSIGKKLRDELFGKWEECEKKHKELSEDHDNLIILYKDQATRVLQLEAGDQRKTIAITLLMNEVSRLDSTSDIILRAKAVLELSANITSPYSEEIINALNSLEKKK